MRAVVLGSSDDDAPVLVNQSRDRSVHPTSGAASMSFTLTYRVPPLATLTDGVGHTAGRQEGPTQAVPQLGVFHLSLQVGTSSLPPAMASMVGHRKKWRAELCCTRFLSLDLDRAKILFSLKITDAQGRVISTMGPRAFWFHGENAHGPQRTLPPSASTGGRALAVKAAWGSDGNLRSDPVPGEAYTLHCRLAPLEGVGRDGSIELFEDEEEMQAALTAWSEQAAGATTAAATASPSTTRRAAASASAAAAAAAFASSPSNATRSRGRWGRSSSSSPSPAPALKTEHPPTNNNDTDNAEGSESGPSMVVRLPFPPHRSTAPAAASAAGSSSSSSTNNIPGGGKMPPPPPSPSKRGAGAAGAGASPGWKRRRGAAVGAAASASSPPSSSSDTDGSHCSSCGGGVGAGGAWKGVGTGGPLVVPTVEQLLRFGYAELRELQQVIGQAMDRLYEEEALCPVCLAKERVFACVPCGHSFCEDDVAKLIDGKCHVCSKRVTQKLRLY